MVLDNDVVFYARTFDEINEQACKGTLYEGKQYSDMEQHDKLFNIYIEKQLSYFSTNIPRSFSFSYMSEDDRNILIATAEIIKRRSTTKNMLNLCVSQLDITFYNYLVMLTNMQVDNQRQLTLALKNCNEIFEKYRNKVWIEKKC